MEEKIVLNRTYLNSLSVYRLREIGREKGVKAPTSFKKKELIDQILAIEEGRAKPYFNINKKGRPSLDCRENQTNSPKLEKEIGLDKLYRIGKLIAQCEKQILQIIYEE